MLDQGFARSRKANSINRDSRLVYATLISFLDREGRINAQPFVLKATVFLQSDFTIEELASAIKDMVRVGLIRLYADGDNAAILEYVDFAKYNKPNKREAPSKYPSPDDDKAMPCRDEMLVDNESFTDVARAHEPTQDASTDDAPTMHVQRTDAVRVNVNVNGTLTEGESLTDSLQPAPTIESKQPVETGRLEGRPSSGMSLPAVTAYLDRVAEREPNPIDQAMDAIKARWAEKVN